MGLAKPPAGEVQAGTSTELTDNGDINSTPLAQHPSALLTVGNEPHLRKPLGIMEMSVAKSHFCVILYCSTTSQKSQK